MRRPVRSTERKHGAEALAEKRPEKAGRVAVAHRSVLERVVADHLGVVGARGEEGEEQHHFQRPPPQVILNKKYLFRSHFQKKI